MITMMMITMMMMMMMMMMCQDCPGEQQWCDTTDGVCKYGCDEQEDCPDGKICIIANHMCQC